MTFNFFFTGSSGWRLLESFISAPWPFAHQWFPLMPLPMNITAKRLGAVVAPQTGRDSNQGSAIVTPAPRRNIRRDVLISITSLVQELRAGDDRLHQRVEAVPICRQFTAHLFDRGLVRKDQTPA